MVLKKILKYCGVALSLVAICFAMLNINIQPASAYSYPEFREGSLMGSPFVYAKMQYGDYTFDLPFGAMAYETGVNDNEWRYWITDGRSMSIASALILESGTTMQYNISADTQNAGLFTNEVSLVWEDEFILPAGAYELFYISVNVRSPNAVGVIEYYERVEQEVNGVVTVNFVPRIKYLEFGSSDTGSFSYTFSSPNTVIVTNLQVVVELFEPSEVIFISVPQGFSDDRELEAITEWNTSVQTEVVYSDFPDDWTSWLASAVSGLFNFEIAPNFSFGTLFATVCGVLLFMFFIHVFKG